MMERHMSGSVRADSVAMVGDEAQAARLTLWPLAFGFFFLSPLLPPTQYLQSRELEYIMGCNNLYEYTHVFYIASYKRFWATGRVVQLVQKLLLCCFLLALSQYNAGLTDAVLLTQSVLFLCIIMIPICFNIFFRTYRCQSSNFLKAVLDSYVTHTHTQTQTLGR